jgi:hypothetical protein
MGIHRGGAGSNRHDAEARVDSLQVIRIGRHHAVIARPRAEHDGRVDYVRRPSHPAELPAALRTPLRHGAASLGDQHLSGGRTATFDMVTPGIIPTRGLSAKARITMHERCAQCGSTLRRLMLKRFAGGADEMPRAAYATEVGVRGSKVSERGPAKRVEGAVILGSLTNDVAGLRSPGRVLHRNAVKLSGRTPPCSLPLY